MNKIKIPFFSLQKQHSKMFSLLENSFKKILETQQFIGGTTVEKFEKEIADYLKINHAISCNSGTDALWLALKAIDIKPQNIVLTTSFSFIASASEIIAHNAIPVFIDIEETTYNIDPTKIEDWLSKNCIKKGNITKHKKTGYDVISIVSVNIFGQCADYEKINKIANEWDLWIIEDACQSLGAEFKGKKSGTFGHLGCFSFYPTKNLGGLGDGGMIVTDNPKLASKLKKLKNHGRTTAYNYEILGRNSRLDAMQAAFLSEKLKFLDELNHKRTQLASLYIEELQKLPIHLPIPQKGKHVYHQFSIRVKQNLRDQLQKHLLEKGIGTKIFYEETLNNIPFLSPNPYLQNSCPVAEKISKEILSLPIWPELEKENISFISQKIKNFLTTVTKPTKNIKREKVVTP